MNVNPTLNFSSSLVATHDHIAEAIATQRQFFATGATRPLENRKLQLQKLLQMVETNAEAIMAALKADLQKPAIEAFGSEVLVLVSEIKAALKNLPQWIKPKSVATPINVFPARAMVMPEPKGCVLIIAPWNYPFQLVISPLLGAIAAGNCAILKPSEHTPHTAALITELIHQTFEPGWVRVITGGIETSQALLAERFDHIFFTGGTAVGKIVMAAAAKYLTPVTLELGGKSPCIVDIACNLNLTAKRIVWGKFYNCGQTCVAPDYVLVPEALKDNLLKYMIGYVKRFYTDQPQTSPDYARIINEVQFDRLTGLLQSAQGGKLHAGGNYNRGEKYIAPTILELGTIAEAQHLPIMQEEIFGPILPVLTYQTFDEALEFVRSREKPLALYIFSDDKANQERVLQELSFGGGCINDTVLHLVPPELPFGGIGYSGMGQYSGKYSFETFSHYKGILKKPFFLDVEWRYPPYKLSLDTLKKIL